MKSLPALSIKQLSVNYQRTSVLWDISLDVPSGHLVGIIGPNGAGKSTLIKAVLGLVKPISGKVAFFGNALKNYRQGIAYVPQRETVDWDFPITVEELVLMGRYGKIGLFRRPKKTDRDLAARYLHMVGMEAYAKRQINQLSGGQQQRIFLARALAQDAAIYFLDEPFTGIDIPSSQVIASILKGLKEEGKTLFVVHHDLEMVPSLFDWVILLNMRLVACGKTETCFTEELIQKAYGRDSRLFQEAHHLDQEKKKGCFA